MPILARCRGCRTLIAQTETRCAKCKGNTSWGNNRDRATQARFRKAVLTAAGHQCQAAGCTATTGLQAHHTEPGNWDPRTGLALCREHHRAIDPHAR